MTGNYHAAANTVQFIGQEHDMMYHSLSGTAIWYQWLEELVFRDGMGVTTSNFLHPLSAAAYSYLSDLRKEDLVSGTDCKATLGKFVILGYTKKMDFTQESEIWIQDLALT